MNHLFENLGVLKLFQVLAVLLLCVGMFGIQYDQNGKIKDYIVNAVEREEGYNESLKAKIDEIVHRNPNTVVDYEIIQEDSPLYKTIYKIVVEAKLKLFFINTSFTYTMTDYASVTK